MSDSEVGKEAEKKIREWLDRPQDGYSFDRIPDQMTGFYGSTNICDFTCFKYPEYYYIESKATYADRFDFSMITDTQFTGLLKKSKIAHCHGWVIVLFASYKRAFRLDIRDIQVLMEQGTKSVNITKVDKWAIPYKELQTIPNNRKKHLDYTGEIEDLL